MKIGAQLYTLREYCKNLDDFAETLKRVADIGYQTVQVSGTCGYEAEWLAEQLEKNGLACPITHYNVEEILNRPRETAAFHQAFGCRYIGIGCTPYGLDSQESYDRFVDDYLPAAKAIRDSGGLLMYHNHQFELMKSDDGRIYLERMAEDFAPNELGFTLDTYWLQYGGADPADWIAKLSGRVPCVHLKDMACVNHEPRMAVVGEGNLNFPRILSACEAAGTEFLLVEQDDCYGKDPFVCLKRSYDYLKAQGLS